MKGLTTLLTLALVCGLCRPDHHHAKHFETVYSWSGIDFVFESEEARNTSLHDHTFIPGNAVPWGVDVDHKGRMFMALVKMMPGIPASFVTVSESTNQKGEHFVQPYPDWSWHDKGCDGITSVEKFAIDECNRLWIMDGGSVYTKGVMHRHTQVCPPQIHVFDLKTDQLIKQHKFGEDIVFNDSAFSTIVVEVMSTDNDCQDTFAYVADSGNYGLVVYDFHHDTAHLVEANELYPQPEYGRFHVNGVEFDHMFGVYSMTLNPKSSPERILYFNSMASGKENHVLTSVLKKKENFLEYNHVPSAFVTYPQPRPGGQTGSEVMDEHGIMFFNSIDQMKVFCWNHKADYTPEHMAEVDRDDEAFHLFADMKIVKKDGEAFLYILTNNYQKFLFGIPTMDEVLFRVMKAPIHSLVEGTVCASDGAH